MELFFSLGAFLMLSYKFKFIHIANYNDENNCEPIKFMLSSPLSLCDANKTHTLHFTGRTTNLMECKRFS